MATLNLFFLLKLVSYLMLTLCMFTPSLAMAYSGVTIVFSSPTAANTEFLESFKAEILAAKNSKLTVRMIDLDDADKLLIADNSELVIALGVKALETASKLKHTTPIIGVFTPLPAFNRLLEASHRDLGNFTAIVLDQPFTRQLSLIKIMMPEAKRVGILLGPTSSKYAEYLKEEGEKAGRSINIEYISQESELIPQLKKTLENNDVLLAVPDALIYNRETAQAILLTTYRHQKPVFGYSLSYVRAGGLAAVYSTAKQIAKQAAELAIKAEQATSLLPPPQAPRYFSITVNYQVARSLSLPILDEDAIDKKMRQAEIAEHEVGRN